jgi:hypothetical protein
MSSCEVGLVCSPQQMQPSSPQLCLTLKEGHRAPLHHSFCQQLMLKECNGNAMCGLPLTVVAPKAWSPYCCAGPAH